MMPQSSHILRKDETSGMLPEPRIVNCQNCEKPLTGKQGLWCSSLCANRFKSRERYRRLHGITEPPIRGSESCHRCGAPISMARRAHNAMFCSGKCSTQHASAYYAALQPPYYNARLSSGVVGAAHEMIVAADLILRGLHVFRAVSQSCQCDLAILDSENRLWRVEVTTGCYNLKGGISHPTKDSSRFDLLAIVGRSDGKITYRPPLSELGLEPQPKMAG